MASKPPDLTIRNARPDDFEPMLEITHRALRELASSAYPLHEIDEAIATGAWTLSRELLLHDHYYVAESENRLLGGIGWNRTWLGATEEPTPRREDVAALRAMFVSPDVAGMGVGSRLLQHCIAEIRAAGLAGIELYASFNAEAMYARHGFRPLALQRLTLESGAVMMGRRMRLLFESASGS